MHATLQMDYETVKAILEAHVRALMPNGPYTHFGIEIGRYQEPVIQMYDDAGWAAKLAEDAESERRMAEYQAQKLAEKAGAA